MAKAERVAESVAEKMYQQLGGKLLRLPNMIRTWKYLEASRSVSGAVCCSSAGSYAWNW